MRATILAVLLGVLLAACGGDAGTTPPAEDGTAFPGSEDPDLAGHAQTARGDLAAELGVAAEEIAIVLAEGVTWRDGSLGCPEAGTSYTQALVEGYRVELEHDGETYHYHGQDGQPPFHCADPSEPTGGS